MKVINFSKSYLFSVSKKISFFQQIFINKTFVKLVLNTNQSNMILFSDVDKHMAERITEQQKTFTDHVQSLKDIEENIELSLGEFALTMKQLLPQTVLELKTIRN